jgi:L-lactate utilization protein LutC
MDFTTLATPERLQKAIRAVQARGIATEYLSTKEAALARLQTLIPDGAQVMTAGSITLKEIGFEAQLCAGYHAWRNLRGEVQAENDVVKRAILRRQANLADYSVGSVHAITESGEIAIASQTGSQLISYLYSRNVIWVAGTHKIVSTLEDALRRIREYCAPRQEEMGISLGRAGMGTIGKILLFETEVAYLQRKIHLLLVNEVLGY